MWAAFVAFVLLALAVDLRLMRQQRPARGQHARGAGLGRGLDRAGAGCSTPALWWCCRAHAGAEATRVALEFLTGYLVEKSLAVDNIFVFLMLFTYFAVPAALAAARAGATACSARSCCARCMIFAGAALIARSTGCCTCSAPSCWSPASRCSGPPARRRTWSAIRCCAGCTAHLPLTAGLPRRGASGRRRRRAPATRRCSSCW